MVTSVKCRTSLNSNCKYTYISLWEWWLLVLIVKSTESRITRRLSSGDVCSGLSWFLSFRWKDLATVSGSIPCLGSWSAWAGEGAEYMAPYSSCEPSVTSCFEFLPSTTISQISWHLFPLSYLYHSNGGEKKTRPWGSWNILRIQLPWTCGLNGASNSSCGSQIHIWKREDAVFKAKERCSLLQAHSGVYFHLPCAALPSQPKLTRCFQTLCP